MSELKKVMSLIGGSSVPRQMMTLLDLGTGDRASSHYEKYAPKSRVIISVQEGLTDVKSADPKPTELTEGSKPIAKETARSSVKDSFLIQVEALLPDEVYHPIAEFTHEGSGTSELLIDDLPSNWRISVKTKSKQSYSVFGY